MRLTLRTILAYLDDVLGPNEAKEIGKRINDNPEASALVARIKEVLRKRRVGAPELSGAGSGPDPNLVSDYLENSLTPIEVVELERLCMESDMHLAEVAACHKILTMVLSHPLDVPDEVRERMYVLGAHHSSKKAATTSGLPLEEQPIAKDFEEASSLPERLPDYLTQKPVWQRFSTIAIGLLVGLIWLGLLYSDSSLWGVQQDTLAKNSTVLQSEEPQQDVPRKPDAQPLQPELANNSDQQNPVMQPVPKTPVSINPIPPGEGIVATAEPAGLSIPHPPGFEDEPVKTDPAKMVHPQLVAVPTVKTGPVKMPLTVLQVDGLVLYQGEAQPDWKVHLNEEIAGGDQVAVPAPFRAQFSLGTDLQLFVKSGTKVKRLADSEVGLTQLELSRGRIIFYRPESVEMETNLIVRISGTDWNIQLTQPDSRIGVEVIPPNPDGHPGTLGPLVYELKIGVLSGEAKISLLHKEPQTITTEDRWTKWDSSSKSFITQQPNIPDWVSPDGEPQTASARSLSLSYQKEFAANASVAQSIGPVIKDRIAANSLFAAQTLSLIDRYIELVPALASEHEETRIAAIEGLRKWLVQNPENGDLLVEEVTRNYPDHEIGSIVTLLWGYSANDLSEPTISQELLQYLKHDQIEIRELAFYYLSRFGKTTKNYRPLLPASERKAAILRLESYLAQSGSFNPAS